MTDSVATPVDAERMLEMTRLYSAPKALVLKMWSDPAMITKWWGPIGFSTITEAMDFRPGGLWLSTMVSADGDRYPNFIRYTETGPDRISFEHSANGGQDTDFRCEIDFEEPEPGKTRMTFRHIYPSKEVREMIAEKYGARQGLKETLTRLDGLLSDRQSADSPFKTHFSLPSSTETRMTRSFRSPRAMVFEALTQEAHIRRWMVLHKFRVKVCDVDSRVGGKWTMLLENEKGQVGGFVATIMDLVPPERFVVRYEFEDRTDLNHTSDTVLEEVDGLTRLTMTTSFATTKARDEMMEIGFDSGTAETFDRLEALLLPSSYDPKFTISRLFKAPQEVVWKAWTEADALAKWWGPKGCVLHVARLDVRPGGTFLYAIDSTELGKLWGKFVYREVVPTTALAFVNSFSDEEGGLSRAPFSNTWPLEVLNVLTLSPENGGTRLHLEAASLSADPAELKQFVEWLGSLTQGFTGTFDALEAYLSDQ